MISVENHQFIHSFSTKKIEWDNPKLHQDEDSFYESIVPLRRSRKGTNLNDPNEFGKIPKEQTTINRLLILPSKRCTDDYVPPKENQVEKILSKKSSYSKSIPYPTSIVINIGSSMPFHLNPTLSNKTPEKSSSDTSVNLKTATDEHSEPLEQIFSQTRSQDEPCRKVKFDGECVPRVQSREQRIINFDESRHPFNQDNITYTKMSASPPKIAPFESLWSFLCCKRKEKDNEIYLPSIASKKKQLSPYVYTYPVYSTDYGCRKGVVQTDYNGISIAPSRLSTIIESEPSSHNLSIKSEHKN